jgi:hypothetical protein
MKSAWNRQDLPIVSAVSDTAVGNLKENGFLVEFINRA